MLSGANNQRGARFDHLVWVHNNKARAVEEANGRKGSLEMEMKIAKETHTLFDMHVLRLMIIKTSRK